MNQVDSERELLARAVAGDRLALQGLLLANHRAIIKYLAEEIPADLRGVIAPEDISQMTYTDAFKHISNIESKDPKAFYTWLKTSARHRLLDVIKHHRAAKWGGGRLAVQPGVDAAASSIDDLLQIVAVDEHTPSRSVARHEAVAAIQLGLAGLKEDYREALRLRYIEGLPVAEIAERMNRTPRAIHMLCNRGLKELRESLGSVSQFLSRKA